MNPNKYFVSESSPYLAKLDKEGNVQGIQGPDKLFFTKVDDFDSETLAIAQENFEKEKEYQRRFAQL